MESWQCTECERKPKFLWHVPKAAYSAAKLLAIRAVIDANVPSKHVAIEALLPVLRRTADGADLRAGVKRDSVTKDEEA